MTLAEFGVNLDWTNAQGMNIVQYTQANPLLISDMSRSEARQEVLPQWISILKEAMQLSRSVRAKKEENEKQKGK